VEDLMQEIFIHAYENLKKLNNKEYFKSWLIRIMLNECYSLQYTNFNCRMAENMVAILKKTIE
jgi:RNA polymerase sigma-70 factor (ECF subfamily)